METGAAKKSIFKNKWFWIVAILVVAAYFYFKPKKEGTQEEGETGKEGEAGAGGGGGGMGGGEGMIPSTGVYPPTRPTLITVVTPQGKHITFSKPPPNLGTPLIGTGGGFTTGGGTKFLPKIFTKKITKSKKKGSSFYPTNSDFSNL